MKTNEYTMQDYDNIKETELNFFNCFKKLSIKR